MFFFYIHSKNDEENDDCNSNYSDEVDNVNHISNIDFIYKYKYVK